MSLSTAPTAAAADEGEGEDEEYDDSDERSAEDEGAWDARCVLIGAVPALVSPGLCAVREGVAGRWALWVTTGVVTGW